MNGRAPRADEANAGPALGADNVKDTLTGGHRQRNHPVGVDGVAEVDSVRVRQGLGRFLEADAVLRGVGDRLRFVPLEVAVHHRRHRATLARDSFIKGRRHRGAALASRYSAISVSKSCA